MARHWVFSMYDDLHIQASLCHPDYADERDAYILEKYGSKCFKRKEEAEFWMDLGGMINTKEDKPIDSIDLGDGRTFSCWKHQVGEVLGYFEGASPRTSKDGKTYYKAPRWPGILCFPSEEDVAIIKKALVEIRDPYVEVAHQEQMREMLINANVAAHGEEHREEIRKVFSKGESN